MKNGIPFRKGITPQNIKKCGWSMKKERDFYQKPRSFLRLPTTLFNVIAGNSFSEWYSIFRLLKI